MNTETVVAIVGGLLVSQAAVASLLYLIYHRDKTFHQKLEDDRTEDRQELHNLQKVVYEKTAFIDSHLKRHHINTYRQLLAAEDIGNMLEPGLARNLRGWAISPDALMAVLRYVEQYRPALILELGGGYSTVALQRLVDKLGLKTEIISIDHEAEYLEQTRYLVGDKAGVTFVHAPLLKYGDKYEWYDMEQIEKAIGSKRKVDMLLVDGPPESTNQYARRPAFERLKSYLAKHYTIILDDAERPDEKKAVEDWVKLDERLRHIYVYTEKGLSVVTTNTDVKSYQLL